MQSWALADQLALDRAQADAKAAAFSAKPLDPAAQQDLKDLHIVVQAALAQVDMLSRQDALTEVLQHRISDQEEVLQQLQGELELVDAQKVRGALLGFRVACG